MSVTVESPVLVGEERRARANSGVQALHGSCSASAGKCAQVGFHSWLISVQFASEITIFFSVLEKERLSFTPANSNAKSECGFKPAHGCFSQARIQLLCTFLTGSGVKSFPCSCRTYPTLPLRYKPWNPRGFAARGTSLTASSWSCIWETGGASHSPQISIAWYTMTFWFAFLWLCENTGCFFWVFMNLAASHFLHECYVPWTSDCCCLTLNLPLVSLLVGRSSFFSRDKIVA